MDLLALSDFNLVMAHGGFGKASRSTGRPKATLSRRVAELEASLGVGLLDRGSRMLRPTDAGRELHERTGGLLAEVAEVGQGIALGAPTPRGRLRISAPVVFAHIVLTRIATRFAIDHPLVDLEIVAEDRIVDLVDDGVDLVIRIDPSVDEPLVGRRIMGDRRLLVASPSLQPPSHRAPGEPGVPAVLSTAARTPAAWTVRDRKNRLLRLRPQPVLRLSSLLMIREAVLLGAGAALLPGLLVGDDVAAGRLRCWGIDDRPPVEIWALQNSRRLIGAKVKAFLDALTAAYPDKIYVPRMG